MTKVFISYRRKSWPFTHRLADDLRARLDAEIFVDVTGIDEADFEKAILRHLRQSDVVLLVITEETFTDRIHRDDDWVRREIRTALENEIPLVLVCVDGQLPPSGLPDDIKDVARMQGIKFYPDYFTPAVDKLADFVRRILDPKPKGENNPELDRVAHNELVERIRLSPNSSWANTYFDLVKEVIDVTKLTDDDPRLAMTIPKQFQGWQFLPININNRYVLNAINSEPHWDIGIICSHKFAKRSDLHSGQVWEFGQLPSERKNEERPPILVKLNETLAISHELRQDWHRVLIVELSHAKSSPFRKFHKPLIYRAAIDMQYRGLLLGDAFAHEFER